jgi:hypothetical protein
MTSGKNLGFQLAQMFFVMKIINLIEIKHERKIGEVCEYIEPNVIEDSILCANGESIGFYLTKMPEKMCKLADLANAELQSNNVPKSKMNRGTEKQALAKNQKWVSQYSTIIGSCAPKPHMKRAYANYSSVHGVKTAQTFIKAMLLLAKESEQLIKEILPNQYEKQLELFKQVPDKWKFGNLFTSSISNYNISAPFHRDTGNIVGAVNVIITKRFNSTGGNLYVPDYNAIFNQCNNSILVYPAWKNIHAVTPIKQLTDNGYRNSLVFYPLRAFLNLNQ